MGSKMYFIQEGIVDVITKDGEVATSLSDGSYFGGMYLVSHYGPASKTPLRWCFTGRPTVARDCMLDGLDNSNLYQLVYCLFGNFRESFIFAINVKRHICDFKKS